VFFPVSSRSPLFRPTIGCRPILGPTLWVLPPPPPPPSKQTGIPHPFFFWLLFRVDAFFSCGLRTFPTPPQASTGFLPSPPPFFRLAAKHSRSQLFLAVHDLVTCQSVFFAPPLQGVSAIPWLLRWAYFSFSLSPNTSFLRLPNSLRFPDGFTPFPTFPDQFLLVLCPFSGTSLFPPWSEPRCPAVFLGQC